MTNKTLKSAALFSICGLIWASPAVAQNTFIDCSIPNDQCNMLYSTPEAFMPAALNQIAGHGNPGDIVLPPQIARDSNMPIAVSQPYNPQPNPLIPPPNGQVQPVSFEAYTYTRTQNGMAPQAFNQPVVGTSLTQQERAVVAPPYVSQPDKKEVVIKDTPNGSVITQTEKSSHEEDDGTIIEISRVKETAISPKYVNMPSISEAQRNARIKYGATPHDWQALKGETLRTLLMEWGEKSGWTVVWQLDRDYVLEAGVVFRGTFTEVSSAILRTFARAKPAPIGTFYKGNRVLVVNTQEDDNAR